MNEGIETTGKERCRCCGGRKMFWIPIAVVAGIFIFGEVVMLLWNCLMPVVFKLGTINYWQAIGLLILAKIFFARPGGGFRGGRGCRRGGYSGKDWKEKWHSMTEEERAKFKEEWKNRGGSCGC